jgi:hypothetical protein
MTRDEAVRRFEPINSEFADYDREGVRGDFTNVSLQEASRFAMLCLAYIEGVSGEGSVYARHAQRLVDRCAPGEVSIVPLLFGVAQALNDEVVQGLVPGIQGAEE